jgi:RimJ/RimL family protein N-acetyltransferase
MPQAKIRPLEMNDLDNMMSWVNDPEVIGKFACFKNISREQEKEYLEDILASEKDLMFAVEAENGDYVGNICLHDINYQRKSGRLAIILGNKNYWGKGYAQSAVDELLKIAFDKYDLHKIWAITLEHNDKMQHVLRTVLEQEYSSKFEAVSANA